MSRRVILVVAALSLMAAACGTRITEDTSGPATSLVERRVGAIEGAAPGAADGAGAESLGDTVGAAGTQPGATGGTEPTAASGDTGADGATGAPQGPAAGAPIMLGAVGTKSGLVGAALANGFRGLTVWEKWVNANGGVQGRPVKIIQVDDAGDPGKHAAAVRRLIREDGVVTFIGNIAPFTLSAGLPLLEEAKVPAIGGDGGDTSWFRSPVAFPINGQSVSRSRPAARWALANLTQRKAAIFYVSEAEAPSVLAENFADEWKRGGGQVVVKAGVSLATPDFTGEVVQAKNSGADILYIVLEKSACNRFFDAAQRQEYKPIIIAPACTIDTALGHKDLTTNRLYLASAARSPRPGASPAQDEAVAAAKRFDPSLSLDGAFMFGWLAGKLFEATMAQPGAVLTGSGIMDALHRLPATSLGDLTPTQAWPPGPHPEGRCGLISKFDGTQFALLTPDFICA